MAKPKPKRIRSDSCPVRVDGAIYYPHEDEWVELLPIETIGELRARCHMMRLGAEFNALRNEPDAATRWYTTIDRHYSELCEYLATRIFAWNWTDFHGRPLPAPSDPEGKPLGLLKLSADELYWLMNATDSETETERKNA